MDERQHRALFTFGVIADIQYADMDDGYNFTQTSKRFYRSSLDLLRNALRTWSDQDPVPMFVLQLGDIVDGFNKGRGTSAQALDLVLAEFCSGPSPVHHVWGNHELYNFSRTNLLSSRLNTTPRGPGSVQPASRFYAYRFNPFPGFTFVVLDAYDVSLLGQDESSEEYRRAMDLIKQFNTNDDLNTPPVPAGLQRRFTMFNGGFSQEQLDWLDSLLSEADHKERVIIVSHLPVHPLSTDPICLAWNFDELLAVIKAHSCVVCFMAGHDHEGGYHLDQDTGVHHLTMEGVIETPPDSDAFGTVSVYKDRMVLEGRGRVADRVLLFP